MNTNFLHPKVNEERSGSRSVSQKYGSGSASKCHGSSTLKKGCPSEIMRKEKETCKTDKCMLQWSIYGILPSTNIKHPTYMSELCAGTGTLEVLYDMVPVWGRRNLDLFNFLAFLFFFLYLFYHVLDFNLTCIKVEGSYMSDMVITRKLNLASRN